MRSKLMALALLLLAPLVIAARPPAPPLPAFHGEYEVLRNGKPMGRATIDLHYVEGEVWELVTHTEGTQGLAAMAGADIREQSSFRWREGRPELVSYRYAQKVAWKHKQRALDADPERHLIRSGDGEHDWRLRFDTGVQDRHTVVLALAADLAGAREDFVYQVADKDKVEAQRYRRAEDETVRVPAGEFATARLERIREKPGRTTTSWLAAKLNYMPVRIVQREPDGETIEMRLRETRQ